jgi:phosphoribosylamine--glycine ligase
VLGVTARASTVEEARDRAYAVARTIHWDGVDFRTDIAARAIQ